MIGSGEEPACRIGKDLLGAAVSHIPLHLIRTLPGFMSSAQVPNLTPFQTVLPLARTGRCSADHLKW